MKKRIANGIELLFIIASLAILLIPSVSVVQTHGERTSVMYLIGQTTVYAVPMFALFALCSIMCVVSIVSKSTHKDGFIHSFLAILLFIQTNWCVITSASGDQIITNNFPTGIFEICLFAVVVVSFVKRSTMIVGLPEVKVAVEATTTNADELKKYKDLLDSGAISQEEFDAKKKQLLGL